ncbi:hypothetical protein ACVME8_006595 [Bradyrhizobium diazoefficiens]
MGPFGAIWVEKMGEAFFALDEDRKYLPNIVAGLLEEASRMALEAKRAEAVDWVKAVSQLPDGDETSKDSLAILIELRARGFEVSKNAGAGALVIAKDGSGTSYARSNADVVRLGQILLREPR